MKIFPLIFALLAFLQIAPKNNVYICDSPSAKKYHFKNDCRGLSRCTHRIIELSLEEAKKRKFEMCKFEN